MPTFGIACSPQEYEYKNEKGDTERSLLENYAVRWLAKGLAGDRQVQRGFVYWSPPRTEHFCILARDPSQYAHRLVTSGVENRDRFSTESLEPRDVP